MQKHVFWFRDGLDSAKKVALGFFSFGRFCLIFLTTITEIVSNFACWAKWHQFEYVAHGYHRFSTFLIPKTSTFRTLKWSVLQATFVEPQAKQNASFVVYRGHAVPHTSTAQVLLMYSYVSVWSPRQRCVSMSRTSKCHSHQHNNRHDRNRTSTSGLPCPSQKISIRLTCMRVRHRHFPDADMR